MAKILVAGRAMNGPASVLSDLACAGHEVIRVGHGGRALGVLDKEAVDLIISDLDMPHLDGIGLAMLASTKARRPAFILLVSGEWTRTLDDRAAEAGIDSRFLASSPNREDLRGEVDRLLGRAGMERVQSPHRAQRGRPSPVGA